MVICNMVSSRSMNNTKIVRDSNPALPASGARAAGLRQAMVPPRHSAPLHRAHHLILPQCDPAGPEGAREGRQTGGAR